MDSTGLSVILYVTPVVGTGPLQGVDCGRKKSLWASAMSRLIGGEHSCPVEVVNDLDSD